MCACQKAAFFVVPRSWVFHRLLKAPITFKQNFLPNCLSFSFHLWQLPRLFTYQNTPPPPRPNQPGIAWTGSWASNIGWGSRVLALYQSCCMLVGAEGVVAELRCSVGCLEDQPDISHGKLIVHTTLVQGELLKKIPNYPGIVLKWSRRFKSLSGLCI